MKTNYHSPMLSVERFTPNEYVAACGSTGTAYGFNCNAGNPSLKYNVYYSDGTPLAHAKQELPFDYYHACFTTHTADSNSGFHDGYITQQIYDYQITNPDGKGKLVYVGEGEPIPVKIWTNGNTQVHCTTDLDIKNWAVLKS